MTTNAYPIKTTADEYARLDIQASLFRDDARAMLADGRNRRDNFCATVRIRRSNAAFCRTNGRPAPCLCRTGPWSLRPKYPAGSSVFFADNTQYAFCPRQVLINCQKNGREHVRPYDTGHEGQAQGLRRRPCRSRRSRKNPIRSTISQFA